MFSGLIAMVVVGLWSAAALPATAQQKIGYIYSEHIRAQQPESANAQHRLDRLEEQWRSEIESARAEVDTLQEEFQARELLYTDQERARKREAIQQAKEQVQTLRQRYFGPDGELYTRQKELMRPIQERVLAAVEEVATGEGYDYVFDKSGDYLFMFARDQYDLSDAVLRELGITVDRENDAASRRGTPGNPRGNPQGRSPTGGGS